MKRIIELKHVGARRTVQGLLEDLMDRLEEKLGHINSDAVSVHVAFEENNAHRLFRASVTCHVPHHMVAAHEEQRDAGAAIRKAFAEVERQLAKHKAVVQREKLVRRLKRKERALQPSEGKLE